MSPAAVIAMTVTTEPLIYVMFQAGRYRSECSGAAASVVLRRMRSRHLAMKRSRFVGRMM